MGEYIDIAVLKLARWRVSNDVINSFLLSNTRHIADQKNRLRILVKGKESILKLKELFFDKEIRYFKLRDSEDTLCDLQEKHNGLKGKIENELYCFSEAFLCVERTLSREEIQNHAREIESFLPSLYALSPEGRAAAKREELRLKLLGEKGKTNHLYQFLESNYASDIYDFIIGNTSYISDKDKRASFLLKCTDMVNILLSLYGETLQNLEQQEDCKESQKKQFEDYEKSEAKYKEELLVLVSQIMLIESGLSEVESDSRVLHFVNSLNALFEKAIQEEQDLARRREILKSRIIKSRISNPNTNYFIPNADGFREI